jgi:hypothetical protein
MTGTPRELTRVLKLGAVLCFVAWISSMAAAPASGQDWHGTPNGCDYDQRGNRYCWGPSRPAAPPSPDVWGAVAVSPATLLYGNSWNYRTEKDAAQRALQECQKTQSGRDCKVVITVADVCVALAISKPEKIYAVGGPTGAINYANGNATLHCQRAGGRSCTIATALCADGVRHNVAQATVSFGPSSPKR